ncbi:MAG: dodecin family protein [Candidatus Hydrogenedentes bacterium]|nr:dodecin family protein [Candidatus Hydrogenedentota bacterium]
MSIAKVIEVTANSPESFEDAVKRGIERARKTIDDVKGAWIKEQKVVVENGKITEFRVDMKVTFVLHE